MDKSQKETIIPQLLPIQKNTEECHKEVLKNIIKMLTNRGVLGVNDIDKNIKTLTDNMSDNGIYTITTMDKVYPKYAVKLSSHKFVSINKATDVLQFLDEYKNYHKIVVLHDVAKSDGVHNVSKIKTDANIGECEMFLEKELMINLVDVVFIPKHILLSHAEKEDVLINYNVTNKQIPRMSVMDPVARYFNAKQFDVFRIIRPSDVTGYDVSYRIVA